MTNDNRNSTESAPLTQADLKALQGSIDRLTNVVGLAVQTLDRHARVTDRKLSSQAAQATDGLVVVHRLPDGSQKVIVRDTATASQAVAAQVEAAMTREDNEWSTY